MIINDSNIKLSKEERELLGRFFSENSDFIENNSFLEYKNIELLGDLYESFIEENSLEDNDILKLFLAEIRYDQIAFKITNDTNKMKVARLAVPKNRLNETISKWYKESRITDYVSTSSINKTLKKKLEQNSNERLRSIEAADSFVVK